MDFEYTETIPIVTKTLMNADGGELFIEESQEESLKYIDSKVKESGFRIINGFGFRAFCKDVVKFAYSDNLTLKSIEDAGKKIQSHSNASFAIKVPKSYNSLYGDSNPTNDISFKDKIAVLEKIDQYARSKEPLVSQVQILLSSKYQKVHIVTKHGDLLSDIRPLISIKIVIVVKKGEKSGRGISGKGGRLKSIQVLDSWQEITDQAIKQAMLNLDAVPAPAGEMNVVLGNGIAGILLHEAVGHGLEGDLNRKKASAFYRLMGEKVASEIVTVVDNGLINGARGSINIDDEGFPSKENILIEKGKVVKYMQDSMNAALMNTESTGNGRRESYAHVVIPRMTNTYMMQGEYNPEEIIGSVNKGIYATNFDGGQVDTASGNFVFSSSEAYLIENGKISTPVKGCCLIGKGINVLKKVSMVGNDLELDPGIATCGKDNQTAPVCVGQPTIKIDSMTVGGQKTE